MKFFIIVNLFSFFSTLIGFTVSQECPQPLCEGNGIKICCSDASSQICAIADKDMDPYYKKGDPYCAVICGDTVCGEGQSCFSYPGDTGTVYQCIGPTAPMKKTIKAIEQNDNGLDVNGKEENSCDFCTSGVCCSAVCAEKNPDYPYAYCPSDNECYYSSGTIYCECSKIELCDSPEYSLIKKHLRTQEMKPQTVKGVSLVSTK